MPKILKWGLLSTARINRALIPPLRASKRNELIAVASRDLERAEAYAKSHAIPRFYGSYEDLLADPEIDVIYNPLPNHLHADWSIRAARAGKHVLCEKPLALTPHEVARMAEAAEQSGTRIVEAFMYRHHPQTLAIEKAIQEGKIGEIQLIRGSFSFTLQRPDDFRWIPEYGGGALWDVGCYPVSFAHLLAGSTPKEVFGWQVTASGGVDETFAGQIHFSNGVLAQFDCSFNLPHQTGMEIRGSRGTLIIPAPFKPDPKQKPFILTDHHKEKLSFKSGDLYLGEIEDLADAILCGHSPRISLAESRENIATLDALLHSARENRVVSPHL